MLKSLVRSLLGKGARSWTVDEVRNLIFAGRLSDAINAAERLYETTPNRELIAMCLAAEIAFRQRRDFDAEQLYKKVLSKEPGFSDAHYGRSLLLLEADQVEAASQHAHFARNGDPNDSRYLAQLGLCHLRLKNYAAAEIPLRRAIQGNELDKSSWNNLGIVLRAKGELAEALTCFNRAISLDAAFSSAVDNLAELNDEVARLGASWRATPVTPAPCQHSTASWEDQFEEIKHQYQFGDNKAALRKADLLLDQWGDDIDLLEKVTVLYQGAGDTRGAIEIAQAFLSRNPSNGRALFIIGLAHFRIGEYSDAEDYLTRAKSCPEVSSSAILTLAQVLHQCEKFEDAVSLLEQVPASELSTSHKAQLAASLAMACEYVRAIALFNELLNAGLPPQSGALNGLAWALVNVGRLQEALTILDKVIEQYPAEPNTRFQRATIRLLSHQFDEGWEDYSYRGIGSINNFRVLPFPRWTGESLEGKTIVVLAEQGLGDQVMFASCLPDLIGKGPRRVIVEVIARVAPTIARSFPGCEVIASSQKRDVSWARGLDDVDCYVPLGDLPRHFRPDVSAFPGGAYLRADPRRVKHWREMLAELGPGPKMGFSWRGGTPATRRVLRTLNLELAQNFLNRLPASWISLQYGPVESDLKDMSDNGVRITHWPEAIQDLDDFAALISALDAVVTVCNTTVHYAGALGIPVWVMAPAIPEWRYGLAGSSMPWYQSARVVRQEEMGEWGAVLDKVGDELLTFLA